MKRVIVLSDTHGLLRPEVLEYLSQADIIIHGGDINTQAIVDKLREYAPLYIVRGNNDKDWAEGVPQSLIFSIEATRKRQPHDTLASCGCLPLGKLLYQTWPLAPPPFFRRP